MGLSDCACGLVSAPVNFFSSSYEAKCGSMLTFLLRSNVEVNRLEEMFEMLDTTDPRLTSTTVSPLAAKVAEERSHSLNPVIVERYTR